MKANKIKYYSTNGRSPEVTFREALLKGLAPDGGLYLPGKYPEMKPGELDSLVGKEYYEIAFRIIRKYIGSEVTDKDLLKICSDSYSFDVPVEHVTENKFIMRLDQGPTASFKDFAARMMSRLMQHFLSADNQYLTILTATSGDTGSAVANAFYGLKNINVVILYPADEVTLIQRKQMTTLDDNIRVIAVRGKFDDCQQMVKQAFLDPALKDVSLSSANSINIGRLLPQSVYYYYAWSRIASESAGIVFSVPSGNFGNLMAGLIASRMGLPVKKFIVATNCNNEVPEFLKTGIYRPIRPSKNCISSAMNVGHPSNLARIIALYGGMMDEKGIIIKEPDLTRMRNEMTGISVTDEETRATIEEASKKLSILLEPHGAIAWRALSDYSKLMENDQSIVFISLETAHPGKFPEEIKQILNSEPPVPEQFKELSNKNENYLTIDNKYEMLKDFILEFDKTSKH